VAGTELDYRDYKIGQDAAAASKKEIVAELLTSLANSGWLTDEKRDLGEEDRADLALYADNNPPLAKTAVANLLEFGRIVHAEMAAICDAALRGISVKGATLFCTTFPCHMCARHIVAAGIARVVYIEPYPKSRAKKLYKRAIQVDHDSTADHDAVKFEAFVGVAPTRFLDLFEMVQRKDGQGYALKTSVGEDSVPKGVTSGSSAELESKYVSSIKDADWTQLSLDGDQRPQ
jgi:deoxycytidylate deaminase